MINLFLAGVQAPRTFTNMPGEPRQPEPYAIEAKEFVALRLLNRDVEVVLQGDRGCGTNGPHSLAVALWHCGRHRQNQSRVRDCPAPQRQHISGASEAR